MEPPWSASQVFIAHSRYSSICDWVQIERTLWLPLHVSTLWPRAKLSICLSLSNLLQCFVKGLQTHKNTSAHMRHKNQKCLSLFHLILLSFKAFKWKWGTVTSSTCFSLFAAHSISIICLDCTCAICWINLSKKVLNVLHCLLDWIWEQPEIYLTIFWAFQLLHTVLACLFSTFLIVALPLQLPILTPWDAW